MYSDIKQAYYGGITEVYKPHGTNLYYYDINSLYPFAALNDMVGLSCRKLLASGDHNLLELFGFFYCKTDASKVNNQYLGLLPMRSDILLFPHGIWEGWYFSEELKFAEEHGYKISIIQGYNFTREKNVFDRYVYSIFEKKVNASHSTNKTIAKSLLNNLLGRFGIDLIKH